MDSLTQIILGAAVGEAVLGRKIGNRAMVWGAIGGTIPDLDVLANLFMNPLEAMCSHRGITHSIFFSVVAAIFFAWLISFLYNSGVYRSRFYKTAITAINVVILVLITFGLYSATSSGFVLTISVAFSGLLIWRLVKGYLLGPMPSVRASYGEWYLLFFLAFFTHIALDCFTAYGTQVFQPFNDTRVAFNTISVADPIYTVPFLLCLVLAMIARRSSKLRRALNWSGIIISSTYLLLTVLNHFYIHRVFDRALEKRGIETQRQIVNPVILQNVLWNCVAESEDAYYQGLYSWFDSDPYMHVLNELKKNPEAVAKIEDSYEYGRLYWFSNGYLQVVENDTAFELMDLRFGPMQDSIRDGSDFVFRFELMPDGDNLIYRQIENRPTELGEAFRDFKTRVKGY